MAYVITQNCCKDATCIEECPVDCIRPTPDDPGFVDAEMLYIDPETCIDCGACMDVCPVDAISQADDLLGSNAAYVQLNRRYFEIEPLDSTGRQRVPPPARKMPPGRTPLRVAVVGTGPSAMYTVEDLLHNHIGDVEVDVFEKSSFVGGLVRYGVAPDHAKTKAISARFEPLLADRRVQLFLNVEVGAAISHDDLLASHHAVVYATGAAGDRSLEIPGLSLPGSWSAPEFVGWYNGLPEYARLPVDLDTTTAVVIGNGNVALDMARILVAGTDHLGPTDIASHALERLGRSRVKEVYVIGRRGPAEAAFTGPELRGLDAISGVRTEIDLGTLAFADTSTTEFETAEKVGLLKRFHEKPRADGDRRIVLSFGRTPVAIHGADRVTGLDVVQNALAVNAQGRPEAVPSGRLERIECGLVIRATGFRSAAVPGVPFAADRGVIPSESGRVVSPDSEQPIPGVYTCGWIKRGPRGVIGSNRGCAAETVAALMADWAAEALPVPDVDPEAFAAFVATRCPDRLDYADWKAIDRAEVAAGRESGRSRVKLTSDDEVRRLLKRTEIVTRSA